MDRLYISLTVYFSALSVEEADFVPGMRTEMLFISEPHPAAINAISEGGDDRDT